MIIIREALRRGAVLASLVGHTSNVLSICFAPDGTKLVSGSLDQTVGLFPSLYRLQHNTHD